MKTRDRWSVGPLRSEWYVRRNGSPLGRYRTQREAIAFAVKLCRSRWKELNRPAELAIRGRDGAIRDARTYGNDPRSSKG